MATTHSDSEALGDQVWELPPLILHPFADRASSDRLVENSRNALMACGALPTDANDDGLARRLTEGRYAEVRMLYYLGKDVMRWIGQCVEFTASIPPLANLHIREQSFGVLLTRHMPQAVLLKLESWGVNDAAAIFARAVGLNQIFSQPPEFDHLSEGFLRGYHRYADALFACWQQMTGFREITRANFRFELFASGEYTKKLEHEWGAAE